MMFGSKRGQVTIFVIIGLILIIGASIYFYLINKEKSDVVNIPRLTGEFGEVQTYVEGCIGQVAREGIVKLGDHGGYIDPLNDTYTTTMFSSGLEYNNLDQTESDIAFLNWKDKTTGVPYWYYAKSNTGQECWHCSVNTMAPTVYSMEKQLGLYVDANLDSCLDKYQSFKERGFDIVTVSNGTTLVGITNNNVIFYDNLTIQITREAQTQYIESFYQEVDIPLMQYYLLATNLTQADISTEYLDFYTMFLIGQYSGLDSKKLPPISSYRTGYGTVFWSKANTKKLYETQLNSYTQFFRIKGTRNDNADIDSWGADMIESKMYKAMRLPMFTDEAIAKFDLSNKDINHIYPGQALYMDVSPSNGDLISPLVTQDTSSFSKALTSVTPDQSYEFYYDVSYPVIVEISDKRAGHEYLFRIALQANLKSNRVLSDWMSGYGPIAWDDSYVTIFNNVPQGTTLPADWSGEEYSGIPLDYVSNDNSDDQEIYVAKTPSKTFFCDANQRLSGTVKMRTYDSLTERPLSGVKVVYNCGSYSRCDLGLTKYNTTLLTSGFIGKMPLCVNGYLSLEKDGYLTKRMPVTTEYNKAYNIGPIYLEPLITKNATVKKYNISNDGIDVMQILINKFSLVNSSQNISENDSVMLTMSKRTWDEFDEPWVQTLIFGRDGENTTSVELVPGSYIITAQLIDYNGVFIPKECKEECVDKSFMNSVFGGCKETKKIPEEDIAISTAMWGGIEYDENNTFTVTSEDLMGNNTLEFYVLRMPDPRCIDDMQYPSEIEGLSKKYKQELLPKFITDNGTEEVVSG